MFCILITIIEFLSCKGNSKLVRFSRYGFFFYLLLLLVDCVENGNKYSSNKLSMHSQCEPLTGTHDEKEGETIKFRAHIA